MQPINLLVTKAHDVTVGLPLPQVDSAGHVSWVFNFTDFGAYVTALLQFAEWVGSIIVVLSIIYGGYVYLTSQGDSAKLNAAKDRIVGAILGYFLLFLVLAIYAYIKPPTATTTTPTITTPTQTKP